MYAKKMKSLSQRNVCTPTFTALLMIIRYGNSLSTYWQLNKDVTWCACTHTHSNIIQPWERISCYTVHFKYIILFFNYTSIKLQKKKRKEWTVVLQLMLTKFNFPILTSSSPSTVVSFICIVTEKTEWDRLENKTKLLSRYNAKHYLFSFYNIMKAAKKDLNPSG